MDHQLSPGHGLPMGVPASTLASFQSILHTSSQSDYWIMKADAGISLPTLSDRLLEFLGNPPQTTLCI